MSLMGLYLVIRVPKGVAPDSKTLDENKDVGTELSMTSFYLNMSVSQFYLLVVGKYERFANALVNALER